MNVKVLWTCDKRRGLHSVKSDGDKGIGGLERGENLAERRWKVFKGSEKKGIGGRWLYK